MNGIDPAAIGAMIFNSTACYEKFNTLTYEQCKEAADAASEASQRHPLFSREKNGKFAEFDIPHFGKKSSVFCAAVMTAWLVWVQKFLNGNPLPSGALLQASADGLGLFDERKLSDYWKSRKNA